MRCLFFILLMLWALGPARSAAGQSVASMEGGTRAAALGGAATALPGDAWGFSNPAAWATLPGRAVSFFASEGFRMSALRLGAVQYAEVGSWGAAAGGARTFGYEDFRETTFHLGYARGFSLGTTRTFWAGLDVRYHQVALGGGYGSAGAVGLSLGGLVRLLPALHLGFHATNLNAPRLNGREELPRTLSIGLSYAPAERLLVVLDAFKDLDYPVSVRGGLEIRPVDALALRIGAATQPVRLTAGLGLRLGRLRAGIAAERHQALGWTPAASFGLQW